MTKPVDCGPILKALADPTRWSIVRALMARTLTVTELTERVHAPHYNVSKHVKILREAGIIHTEKHGKHVKCQVEEEFRRKLSRDKNQLHVGCCTFRFD